MQDLEGFQQGRKDLHSYFVLNSTLGALINFLDYDASSHGCREFPFT